MAYKVFRAFDKDIDKSIVSYFGNCLNRGNDYNNFMIRADNDSVTVWDNYDTVTISKSDLPNKIARKLYL